MQSLTNTSTDIFRGTTILFDFLIELISSIEETLQVIFQLQVNLTYLNCNFLTGHQTGKLAGTCIEFLMLISFQVKDFPNGKGWRL